MGGQHYNGHQDSCGIMVYGLNLDTTRHSHGGRIVHTGEEDLGLGGGDFDVGRGYGVGPDRGLDHFQMEGEQKERIGSVA